jgi:hypothetical protein
MLASDVIALCDTSGIGAVTTMYGISRRQGEQFVIQARRLVAAGHNPRVSS